MIKLIALTVVKEMEKDAVSLLKNAGIATWSTIIMEGHKQYNENQIETNWFSSSHNNVDSVLLFSFTENEKIEGLIRLQNEFNQKSDCISPIRLAVMHVEQFI
jgi:hypothetical protein